MLLERGFSELLCTQLTVLGARTVETDYGYLAMVTVKESNGSTTEFWAGAAHRADQSTARGDAATDALLTHWHGSVVVAGAARLVRSGACRAAMVIDDAGVTTYGPATEFPLFDGPGISSEPGARLAAHTSRGEFRALSLGVASAMLNVVPGGMNARRVDEWFNALEAALD